MTITKTTTTFWACGCDWAHIHPATRNECPYCGALQADGDPAESHDVEVFLAGEKVHEAAKAYRAALANKKPPAFIASLFIGLLKARQQHDITQGITPRPIF